MKVGYVRCSTEHQNTIRQEVLMEKMGVEKLYVEKISGKNTDRPQLKEMLNFIREGDTVVVESYSRLSRNTTDLLSLINIITEEKKADFKSIKEDIDTSTPTGKFILTVYSGLIAYERETILERQKEGIEEAKKAGKYKGRKPIDKPSNFDEVIDEWKKGKITASFAMKQLNLKRNTFYRMVEKTGKN